MNRPLLFAGLALSLSFIVTLLLGTALLALDFGLAVLFALSFILVPFIAAYIVGWRSPVQLILILIEIVTVGPILQQASGGIPLLQFIMTALTYVAAGYLTEVIRP